jgi:hypothetical protein
MEDVVRFFSWEDVLWAGQRAVDELCDLAQTPFRPRPCHRL